MSQPRHWTITELNDDAEHARRLFRRWRQTETLGLYSAHFDTFVPIFDHLIDQLPSLAEKSPQAKTIADLLHNRNEWTAFRYLAAPPVSEDDLKTLSESTLAVSNLRADADEARRVGDVVLRAIDPHRFPWIVDQRVANETEKTIAVVASAVLVAARKVETARRGDAKRLQENGVKNLLRNSGLREVDARDVPLLDAAPQPGEFCGESSLGGTRADIIVRLFDGRAMPLECKVSNSAVNSFKRINHEAAGKARDWLSGFGQRQVVPAAVIAGVFNPSNLAEAQAGRLALFWNHRLGDLADFIVSTKA